jgi:opacity protein-like surface antigen
MMRNILLAAVAVATLATPAMARDGSPYVGIEGGLMIVEDFDSDVTVRNGAVTTRYDDAFSVDFKRGIDVDAIAGYDFGMFRLEGELGYKRARADEVLVTAPVSSGLTSYDINDRASVLSLMGNAMLDFTDEDSGWSGYVGGGVGRARVKFAGDRDSAFAYQAIAGVRKAVTDNVELGLKYRYFNTRRLNFDDSFTSGTTTLGVNNSGKMRTHSLLASLIFNFGAPAPVVVPVVEPVAPPPAPPATQTCPDGSVILATDVCPQPPVEVAPPAPEPVPERG